MSTESSSSSGESRCGGEQMDLDILGWVTDKFLVRESFLKNVIKQKACLKEILGASGS